MKEYLFELITIILPLGLSIRLISDKALSMFFICSNTPIQRTTSAHASESGKFSADPTKNSLPCIELFFWQILLRFWIYQNQ